MGKSVYVFLLALVFSLCAACSHEWQDPDTSLPAQSVSIAEILASPEVYDMSGVVVIGKIWHPKVESLGLNANGEEQLYTSFTIADRHGIGIDVYVDGKPPITEGEYIRVVGLFRKTFQTQGDFFYNRIDAVRLESWSPNLTYWIREFEFD